MKLKKRTILDLQANKQFTPLSESAQLALKGGIVVIETIEGCIIIDDILG